MDVDGLAAFDSDVLPGKDGGPRVYDPGSSRTRSGRCSCRPSSRRSRRSSGGRRERFYRIAGLTREALGRVPLSEALVKAIAQEASDVAGQFLNICIRAIDYCPPADMELGEYLRALITADGDLERTDKWGFREALMRSFRRRHIFPDHVRFMTEDAVRWQSPERVAAHERTGLPRHGVRRGSRTSGGSVELERQAHALGKFVTNPKYAECFRLDRPVGRLPKGVVQASPPLVQSIRVTRRAAPDGRILFDLVGEVTQSCTVDRQGVLFDVNGGCTVVIDPEGMVRYSIFKRLDSQDRHERQHRRDARTAQALLEEVWPEVRAAESTCCAGCTRGSSSIAWTEPRAVEVPSRDAIRGNLHPFITTHRRSSVTNA